MSSAPVVSSLGYYPGLPSLTYIPTGASRCDSWIELSPLTLLGKIWKKATSPVKIKTGTNKSTKKMPGKSLHLVTFKWDKKYATTPLVTIWDPGGGVGYHCPCPNTVSSRRGKLLSTACTARRESVGMSRNLVASRQHTRKGLAILWPPSYGGPRVI